MSDPAETLTGSCLCGAWRYTVLKQPVKSIICHCDACKKWSGSVFMANILFPRSALDLRPDNAIIPPPQMTTYGDKGSDSGRTVNRHFCARCGSPLYCCTSDFQDMISLPAGSIDGPLGAGSGAEHAMLTGEERRLKGLDPEIEFYCQRATPWVEIKCKTSKLQSLGELGKDGQKP
ncbi:hypothetical protein Z517_00364 [Fonsecaea pedrosoi CBS 271.37]|uniref:CENP-V/GFA domain-containing protein n=1 Tax=Fonsecaea pedrosoi CBS 271.37 TaxID=1442368 RepID=A0A0D2E4J8_9EURO|nr:uncharacterized protein Z517_00364 [Fonsecaea pedrosoi CBS 271.37]KIW84976.1 hypothetical protein Z517_00364 [Fonsecaea pedrosoi CBS 271.37]